MNTAQTIASAGFDISNIAAQEDPANPRTFKVDLTFTPDGDPLAGLIIVGKGSEQYRNESHAIRAEGFKKSARVSTAIDTKTDEGASQLVDTIDDNDRRLALAVVVGWYGFTNAGAAVEFDKRLVEAAFDKFPTWQEKVLAALGNDANFLKV
ncbi:MAG TPA: hypothetical protein VFW00_07085 [Rhodocyclaceae bacterium]|nr:hypothetical protein [Rhodocyclaceae bacterium]